MWRVNIHVYKRIRVSSKRYAAVVGCIEVIFGRSCIVCIVASAGTISRSATRLMYEGVTFMEWFELFVMSDWFMTLLKGLTISVVYLSFVMWLHRGKDDA